MTKQMTIVIGSLRVKENWYTFRGGSSEKIVLHFSESCQVLFSLKNNKKKNQNVNCYNFVQRFKG